MVVLCFVLDPAAVCCYIASAAFAVFLSTTTLLLYDRVGVQFLIPLQ
jgi:hypothetical protein